MAEHRIPKEKIAEICSRINGRYGFYAYVPETGETFTIHPEEQFRAASTIKIPVLALMLKDAGEGRLDLLKKVPLTPDNRVGGSGILCSLTPDISLTPLDFAELMIVLSDNSATNQCIDLVGLERIRDFCTQNGFSQTWIWQKMFFKGILPKPDFPPEVPLNATSAGDLGEMLRRMVNGTFVNPEVDETMIRIMAGQRLGKLKVKLPWAERNDPFSPIELPEEGRVVVACKGGSLVGYGICHDCAVFIFPDGRRVVTVVCTQTDDMYTANDRLAEIGEAMYDAMK